MKKVWSFWKYPVSFLLTFTHTHTHIDFLKTSHFTLASTCFIFVSPEVCLWSPGDVQLHLSGHPCYWRNLFFFVLFEMMGKGNPCAVEWDSKWGHISVALQFILVVGWLNGCAQFLWVVQTVLHRDHSNGFTWIVLCQETVSLSEKSPVEVQLGGHW